MKSPLALLGLLLLASATAGAEPTLTPVSGRITDAALPEISGLAVSRRNPALYWVHNDSFNPAVLYAISAAGEVKARVQVRAAPNVDWEDLASFERDGQPYLALADIGNNFALNEDLHIYVLPEPQLDATEVTPLRDYRFRFADGPRDAESLAVDLPNRRFLIADKGLEPAGLYALPMEGDTGRAERIADIPIRWPGRKPMVMPLALSARAALTAMDLSADGRRLLLLTYRHIMMFERRGAEDWAAALARQPQWAPLPAQPGFEAAGWDADGRSALFTHEKIPALLYRWSPP